MLYAKLVAKLSEITRTLVTQGRRGACEQNSTIFVADTDVHEARNLQTGWLKISGIAGGTYEVLRIVGCEIHVSEPFPTSECNIVWELFDRGVPEGDVRAVLRSFPDVLMECEEGEQVKTYLGVVKIVRRKRKRVKDPQGRWTYSPERLQARLRPGKRLQRLLEGEDASGPSTPSQEPPEDGDPQP